MHIFQMYLIVLFIVGLVLSVNPEGRHPLTDTPTAEGTKRCLQAQFSRAFTNI